MPNKTSPKSKRTEDFILPYLFYQTYRLLFFPSIVISSKARIFPINNSVKSLNKFIWSLNEESLERELTIC